MVDLDAASDFMATHARLLDRRRFDVIMGGGPPDGALAALSAYSNRDGGYSWGLEPDLRDTRSQPGAALHAFEVFEDIAPATTPRAVELCDWLGSVTLPDGGVPFALPVERSGGCAPFWANGDPNVSSLQITAIVTANAQRAAAHDAAVAGHPWLARASDFCAAAIEAMDDPQAMELAFSVQFADAAGDIGLVDKLRRHVPATGVVPVRGGLEDEAMHPLDFAPAPDRPARTLFVPEIIEQELERLAGQQEADGGWPVGFASYSPAAELEWRGYMTVRAVSILKRNSLI